MATLTLQEINLTGVDTTLAAATNTGDQFANADERVQFRVVNAAGVTRVVTIVAQVACNHGTVHSITLSTENGEDFTIGPFDRERFNDSNGMIQVTYSSEVGLTVAALNLDVPPKR